MVGTEPGTDSGAWSGPGTGAGRRGRTGGLPRRGVAWRAAGAGAAVALGGGLGTAPGAAGLPGLPGTAEGAPAPGGGGTGTPPGGGGLVVVDGHCHATPVWYEPVESLISMMDRTGVRHAVLVQIGG